MSKKKVIVIGLDCATPRTLFEDFIDVCPNIEKMLKGGIYGTLRSSDPPITIPAWMVMSTGKNAGKLGLYGFRHRKQNSYNEFWIANSFNVKEPKIWDILGKKGLKSIILGVPPTYPVQEINGHLVSGFITPDTNVDFTFPPELKQEIQENVGDYVLDANFRTENKDDLLVEINQMTKLHFDTVKYLLKNKDWDFCQFVVIGLDRMHHAFWKYFDTSHHKYKHGNKYENAMKNFYKMIDKEVGEILELLEDDTTVIIASDHGAKAMKGVLCVNMALEQLGLLKFKTLPTQKTRLENAEIDWENTYAWGWGGYYARIFLNVIGREKNGIIPLEEYDSWREKVARMIKTIKKPDDSSMNTVVFKPEDLYNELNGDYPDLMIYFDDLNWRSAGTVGYETMYLDENDTGPDDAVHDYYGVFVIYNPKKTIGKRVDTKNIIDIAPTILNIFGIEVPKDMEGTIIEYN
ncbi:MAG: alkaline phosphatase family protein [Promethearchaeota archaeon]